MDVDEKVEMATFSPFCFVALDKIEVEQEVVRVKWIFFEVDK